MRPVFLLAAMVVLVSCQKAYCETSENIMSPEVEIENGLIVPESVALLVRPILDAQYRGYEYERTVGDFLYSLTKNESAAADEALVVLTFFYIGESQEETDAIISRGTKMLSYLEKYRNKNPIIPDRNYPNSMRHDNHGFEGIIPAIKQGMRGTWDNPD